MSQKITKIVTSSISYEEIKNGDVVQLQGDNKTYVLFKYCSAYYLVPIDLTNQKSFNKDDIYKPEIINVFDGKNGHCKIHRDDLIIKLEEEIDDEIR